MEEHQPPAPRTKPGDEPGLRFGTGGWGGGGGVDLRSGGVSAHKMSVPGLSNNNHRLGA